MLHCDLRVRWKVASDLRFRAAISEPKTPSFCGISGDLAPSTRKSLAIAIVRFWCAKFCGDCPGWGGESPDQVARGLPTGGQGSKVYVLCAEPKEHKHFRPGTQPGGSVTGVTEKLFMCQMFMCLFRPLRVLAFSLQGS